MVTYPVLPTPFAVGNNPAFPSPSFLSDLVDVLYVRFGDGLVVSPNLLLAEAGRVIVRLMDLQTT